jgi:hypothetical protein
MGVMPMVMGYLSPAYLMVAPQMAQMGGMSPMLNPMMGQTGMPGASPTESGGHVTHNPTNSMAGSAGAYPGGAYPGGMAGGAMAAPVGFGAFMMAQPILMAPVFLQFGMPVFANYGYGPQPPVAGEVPGPTTGPVPEPVTVEPVDEAVPAPGNEEPAEPEFELPIKQYSAEEFSRFRMKSLDAELVTSLELSLKTKDGDLVTLDFNQVDVLQRTRFAGKSLDGDRVRVNSFNEETDRIVNMNVTGDLSDAEKAAVDAVLERVIEVANKFFDGSVGAALGKLKTMEFDTGTLAELSLKMSMTRSVEFTRAYQGGEEQLRRLASRDGEVNNMLEFFADEQKKLIDMANEVLDGESSARLVKSLLPPMLEEPLQALVEQVAEHQAPQPVEDEEHDA